MSLPESSTNIEENISARSEAAWHHKFPVNNQNYVVMSIVDTGKLPAAIKIFGTYSTEEEANRVSGDISAQNDFFDVYVANTDCWLPVPCGRDFVESVYYQQDKLNQIREGFNVIKEKNAKQLADSIKQDREAKKAACAADTAETNNKYLSANEDNTPADQL